MQGAANGSWACKQLLDHSFNLVTQTSLVQIESEYVLAAVQSLQWAPILLGLPNLQWSNDSLPGSETPIEPGKMDITSNVTIKYTIE